MGAVETLVLCSSSEIQRHMPPLFVPTSDQLTRAKIRAAAKITAKLYPVYWPFPAYTEEEGELTTPEVIQEIAGMLGAADILSRIAATNAKRKGRIVEQLVAEAETMLEQLQAGPETTGGACIPPIVVEEVLDLGASDAVESYQHVLDPFGAGLEGFHLFQESCEIAGLELGDDFGVAFVDSIRKWVVTAPESADGETLTYRIHFYRYREVATPVSDGPLRVVRI